MRCLVFGAGDPSPLAIEDELAARCADGTVSFAQATGYTLDEYVGLPADHPE